MDENGIPVNLDFTEIDGIDVKKSHSYINNFIITSNNLLNKYSSFFEEKLARLETDEFYLLTQLDALEAKLESVDGLKSQSNEEQSSPVVTATNNAENAVPSTAALTQQLTDTSDAVAKVQVDEDPNLCEISKHPRFKKYFDMRKYGVPDPQIQLAMRTGGLDPSTVDLDDPKKKISNEQTHPAQEEDENSMSSDFSD